MTTTTDTTNRRIAIVTGAARGIGAAVARRLAADGMAVAVFDLEEAAGKAVVDDIGGGGGQAVAVGVDVADEASVAAGVQRVVEELGPPTVLVNNAGITRDNMLFKLSAEDWDAVIRVHLRGSFLVTRAAQRYMVEARWGRIVNLSSGSALGNPGQANYSAAKAGVQGFTKAVAIELGKFGVTVNCVAPGFVDTDMTRETAARAGMAFEEFRQAAASRAPVGRTGVPDDIAHAVSFFTSEGAGYVSGQVLYVAGGPRG